MAEQNAQSPPQSLDITSTEGIVEFVDPITDTCNLCTERLLDPYQTKCGHRLCKSCLLKHFENNGDPSMCPFDDEDCEIISLKKNDGSVSILNGSFYVAFRQLTQDKSRQQWLYRVNTPQ